MGVRREYADVRAYVRSLVDLDRRVAEPASEANLAVTVDASFRCDGATAEHVLLIMLEGLRNVRRHAGAATASVGAHGGDKSLRISIHDDGIGFPEGTVAPWSIASRVAELGGGVQVDNPRAGAHLVIQIPTP
jgi:signal transduction histidine kinase